MSTQREIRLQRRQARRLNRGPRVKRLIEKVLKEVERVGQIEAIPGELKKEEVVQAVLRWFDIPFLGPEVERHIVNLLVEVAVAVYLEAKDGEFNPKTLSGELAKAFIEASGEMTAADSKPRQELVDAINAEVDIPLLDEAMEEMLFAFLIRAIFFGLKKAAEKWLESADANVTLSSRLDSARIERSTLPPVQG